MKIMICGATGLIGTALVSALENDHSLTLVGRDQGKIQKMFGQTHVALYWETLLNKGTTFLETFDVIINLAGENIGAKRWSKSQKDKILKSRVTTTRDLATLLAPLGKAAPRLLNASAIGIYGIPPNLRAQNEIVFDETSNLPQPPTDFVSTVGTAWENALAPLKEKGGAIVNLRFGVVLSKKGGALAKMLPAFQFGLGAVMGAGKQPISWVALEDVVRAIIFLLNHPDIEGPVNIVAPNIVSQKSFAKTLAHVLKRPCFMWIPSFMLRLLFGEMANELLLNGQQVKGNVLFSAGFTFQYQTLEKALKGSL